MLKQNYVVFVSPGTLFAETTQKEIDEWDTDEAVKMAHVISERHGAAPYGFYFITRGREDDELDSRNIAESNFYYLGGEVFTLEQVKARNDKSDRILISNMEGNGYDRVLVNYNSYKVTLPLRQDDIILAFTPRKKNSSGW